MNGNWTKWSIGVMAPMVLAMGVWAGSLQQQVWENSKKTQKIEEIDKKVTAILCKVAPERCL